MNNFLDTAREVSTQPDTGDKESFQLVFRGIAALQKVYAKAVIDTRNVEAVFSAFEMADLIRRLPDLEPQDVANLAPALRKVIARTLEATLLFRISDRGSRNAPEPYWRFADFLLRPLGAQEAGVITFNYDLGLDYAFLGRAQPVEYGLGETISSGFRIHKLHGSLNWLRCRKCGVQACDSNAIVNRFVVVEMDHVVRMNTLDSPLRCPRCGTEETDRFLVAPTLSKGEGHRAIRNVWTHAAEMLSHAENIFVIGYSLPATDEFFRYLFALGTISDVPPKRFWVFDPEPAVAPRFEQFLGPTMKDRFRYFRGDFGSALQTLRYEKGKRWPL